MPSFLSPRRSPSRAVSPQVPSRVTPGVRGLVAGGLLLLGTLVAGQPGRAEMLYRLETTCSIKGGAPTPCTVEAHNQDTATLYHHRVGKVTETIRISDDPATMMIWVAASRQWQPLDRASARLSTNTICFNDRDLCVVNPNYINSVREDRANSRLEGRDLVMVHFDKQGRVDASCYDQACKEYVK